MQTSVSARHRVGVIQKDRKGFLGRGLGLFGILNVQLGMPSPPINPHLRGQTDSPSAYEGRAVKEGIVQRV